MTIRSYQVTVQALVTASSLNFTVSQALGLTSEATDGIRREVDQDLSLFQQATWTQQISNGDSIEQPLNLTQEAKAFGFETVENTLVMSSVATREILATLPTNSYLNLGNDAEFGFSVKNLDVSHDVSLSSVANITFTPNVTSALNLSSIAFRAFTPNNDLGLTSTADWGYGYDAESDLDLTDSVAVNQILNQNISHTDVVEQACTYFIESRCNRYEYNRFHGTGGVEPATKKLNYTNQFYLESIDDGTIVTLRNPETDDRQRYAFNRVNRNFFDGSPDIFSDTDWAVEESQLYTIVANKRSELDSVFTFVQDNLGREVILKDWNGVTWVVIITNPGDLHAEDGRDNGCGGLWTIQFEVEGYALDGEWFFSRLGLTETLSRAGSIYNRSASSGSVASQLLGRHYDVDGDVTTLSAPIGFTTDASFVIE